MRDARSPVARLWDSRHGYRGWRGHLSQCGAMQFQKLAVGVPVALSQFIMVAFLQSALAFVVIVFPILHVLAVRDEEPSVR